MMITISCSRIIGGFEDKNGVREFLFALPRFAADKVNDQRIAVSDALIYSSSFF